MSSHFSKEYLARFYFNASFFSEVFVAIHEENSDYKKDGNVLLIFVEISIWHNNQFKFKYNNYNY